MENPDLKAPGSLYPHRAHTFAQSIRYALMGISRTLMTQRNMKLHVLAALSVLLLGLVFPFDTLSKAIILLCIGLVLFSEILNTAMEAIVDLYTGETHRLAQIAKDAAAGGVMVLSLCATFVFLGVLQAHHAQILEVPSLIPKLGFITAIVTLETLCLFDWMSSLLRLLAQACALFGMVLLAISTGEPIFSSAAFLLMALVSFAPMAFKKDEAL